MTLLLDLLHRLPEPWAVSCLYNVVFMFTGVWICAWVSWINCSVLWGPHVCLELVLNCLDWVRHTLIGRALAPWRTVVVRNERNAGTAIVWPIPIPLVECVGRRNATLRRPLVKFVPRSRWRNGDRCIQGRLCALHKAVIGDRYRQKRTGKPNDNGFLVTKARPPPPPLSLPWLSWGSLPYSHRTLWEFPIFLLGQR